MALLGTMGVALTACNNDEGPFSIRIGVLIRPGGYVSPNFFSAPAGSSVIVANQDSVEHYVEFGEPMNGSASLYPGASATFRLPSVDPGYPISFGVAGGGGGSISIY
jgi:hypothetical protein